MPIRLQSLLSCVTDPASFLTTVTATVSLVWFDPQQGKVVPFDPSMYSYKFYFLVQIIEHGGVPAECSQLVECSKPSMPLALTTTKGGNQLVRTACSNENGTLLDINTQNLPIPTCVRRHNY